MAPLTAFDVTSRELIARDVPFYHLRRGDTFAVTQHKKRLLEEGRGLEAHKIDQLVRWAKGGAMPRFDHHDAELGVAAASRDLSRVLMVRGLASLKHSASIYSLRSGRKVCVRAAARRLRRRGLDDLASTVEAFGRAVAGGAKASNELLLNYGPLFAAAPDPPSVC